MAARNRDEVPHLSAGTPNRPRKQHQQRTRSPDSHARPDTKATITMRPPQQLQGTVPYWHQPVAGDPGSKNESACRPGSWARLFLTSVNVLGMLPDLPLRFRQFSALLGSSRADVPPMCIGRGWHLSVRWSVEDQHPAAVRTWTPVTTPAIALSPPLTDLLVLTSARPPAGVKSA
jgi:hypothetical protein